MPMPEKDVESKAKALEGGPVEAMAKELHAMSPEDRLAVAKQITWDLEQHPVPSLPDLQFTDSGELKAADMIENGKDKVHEEFDTATGVRKSKELHAESGNFKRWEYFKNTGNLKSEDEINLVKGTGVFSFAETVHKEYEPGDEYRQGLMKVYDEHTQKGSRHIEMKDGTKTFEEKRDSNGNDVKMYFDRTGDLTTEIRTDKYNTQEKITYDPVTDRQATYDVHFKNKVEVHIELDPNNGEIKVLDRTDDEGHKVHWTPDSSSKEAEMKRIYREASGYVLNDDLSMRYKDGANVLIDRDRNGEVIEHVYSFDDDGDRDR